MNGNGIAMVPTTPCQARLERLLRILPWSALSVVLLGVVSFGIWSLVWNNPLQQSSAGQSPARLPVYGSVPDFALIDQLGRPVRRADLDGKIWIASFIFTNCPDECPLMTSEMAQLQSDLAHNVDLRFVSISVDPERDTPAVLSQYAERFNVDPDRWFFLTGDKQAIYRLAREGFRLGIADPVEPSHASPVKSSAPSGARSSVDRPMPSNVGPPTSWPHLPRLWRRALEPAAAFADHGRAKDTLHSTRFVLIDRLAQIRGYYESREQAALVHLRQHLQMLFQHG
jgi:cytochrome oxidase Cu insertion factor (SCO1/SenC/PrrC family)